MWGGGWGGGILKQNPEFRFLVRVGQNLRIVPLIAFCDTSVVSCYTQLIKNVFKCTSFFGLPLKNFKKKKKNVCRSQIIFYSKEIILQYLRVSSLSRSALDYTVTLYQRHVIDYWMGNICSNKKPKNREITKQEKKKVILQYEGKWTLHSRISRTSILKYIEVY